MAKDKVDIEDLEAFIDGLTDSFDTLENIDENTAVYIKDNLVRYYHDCVGYKQFPVIK